MFTTKIDDKTLGMISEMGDRIADDVSKLENLIWLVKAEAYRQLEEVSARFARAGANGPNTAELVQELHDASTRVMTLEKFWNQEREMRNRAVQFGRLAERNVPGYKAMEVVMQRMLATTPDAEAASKVE